MSCAGARTAANRRFPSPAPSPPCSCSPRKHCSQPTAVAYAGADASWAICRSSSSRRLTLVLEQRQILAKHERVLARRSGEPAAASCRNHSMCCGIQCAPVAIDEAAPRQELEDVVPGLEHFALERLAATHDIAHALFGFARHAHRRELPGAIQPRELRRIILVMFPLDARALSG